MKNIFTTTHCPPHLKDPEDVLEEDGNLLRTLDGGEILSGVLVLPEHALVLLGGQELDEGLEDLWYGHHGGGGWRGGEGHAGAARAR